MLVKLIPLKSSKIGILEKNTSVFRFTYLEEYLQIGEAKVSKFNFMHTLSESKSIFAIEQKAIVSSFAKMLCFYWDTRYTLMKYGLYA